MRDKVTKITRSMKRITALLTLFLAMTFISCKSGKTVGENPFFAEWETPYGVPPFDKIEPEHFLPAIERGMSLPRKVSIMVFIRFTDITIFPVSPIRRFTRPLRTPER